MLWPWSILMYFNGVLSSKMKKKTTQKQTGYLFFLWVLTRPELQQILFFLVAHPYLWVQLHQLLVRHVNRYYLAAPLHQVVQDLPVYLEHLQRWKKRRSGVCGLAMKIFYQELLSSSSIYVIQNNCHESSLKLSEWC